MPNFNDLHEIPNYSNYGINANFDVINLKSKRVLKISMDRYGYKRVVLSNNGIAKSFLLHRVIAIVFIENKENKPQVNHKNGIKTDNRIENLEWCTCAENIKHAFDTGLKFISDKNKYLMQIGSKKANSKKVYQYKNGKKVKEFASQTEAALFFKCRQSTISKIIYGVRKSSKGLILKFN